jgi:hypothetical protein
MKQQLANLFIKKHTGMTQPLPDHNPNATFEWIRFQSRLAYLPLNILIPTDNILEELIRIKPMLVDHRDDYGEHQGWKSFCIHGKSYDATREDSHYNDLRPMAWTAEAQELLPATVKFFMKKWPATNYARLRVMLLEPGGYISVHSDRSDPGLGPINIAITQPDNCEFAMDQAGCIPFTPGSAFWLDISKRHAVKNHSDQDRWHIIVHQNLDHPDFQQTVVNSYHMLYNNLNANSNNHNT